MVNLVRRFKLEYNDVSTGTTTIAETGQDTGALKIDRHVHIRNVNNPDILKVWLEGTNFGDSIPTRISEFGNSQNTDSGGTPLNEPEILYKQYDEDAGSFTTIGRFYAKNTGTINEDGELALKLYSFMRYTARQSVNTGTINGDIEDALNAVLPDGYVADVPVGVTPPSVSNYSLNARREKGFQELTRNYNYALTFTSELDGNNDYLVKFEPVGQGGSVDTVDSSTDAVTFKAWEKDKQDSIINKVTVEGTNSSGNTVTATATNDTQITNFGEKFRKFKVGYIENSSEAQEIAESFLVPGLDDMGNDITKVPESGTIKTVVYSDNIVNDSLNIIDSQRNISDTYTVVQQTNFWPEGASEIELEFEKENLEEAARDAENLRDERARLYPGDTISGSNSNTTTAQTDLTVKDEGTTFDTSPSIASGQSTASFLPQTSNSTSDINFTLANGAINTISNSLTYSGRLLFIDCTLETQAGFGAEFIVEVQVAGAVAESFVTKTNNGGDIDFGVTASGPQSGNTIEFIVVNKSGGSVDIDQQQMFLTGTEGHTHGSGTYESLDHNHAAAVDNDPGHGDTTDTFTHNIELKDDNNNDLNNVNVASEDKTDR